MRSRFLHFLLLFLAGAGGCIPKSAPPPSRTSAPVQVTLEQAVQTAAAQSADVRTLESLQQIAREHVEKSRLLELPDMIYDLPRRIGSLTVENDLRLNSLDHALESCRILTRPAQSDLNAVQKEIEKRKIRREVSFRWAKLAYFSSLKKAGLKSPSLEMREKETLLELSISSGIPEKMIKNFDLTTLPQPHELPLPETPAAAAQIKAFYGSSPDAALRFADIVYRLPAELLHRKDSNFDAAFSLALSVGTAIKLDIVHTYLKEALSNFRKAEEAIKKARIKTPGLYADLEQAKLAWRLAFFRRQYDNIPSSAPADKKERTFLYDLISLQGK